jgi:hypothetical protein
VPYAEAGGGVVGGGVVGGEVVGGEVVGGRVVGGRVVGDADGLLWDGDGDGDLGGDFDGDGDGDADLVGDFDGDGVAFTGSADGLTDWFWNGDTYTFGPAGTECTGVAEDDRLALADGSGASAGAAAPTWSWACASDDVPSGLVRARTATAETTTSPPVT